MKKIFYPLIIFAVILFSTNVYAEISWNNEIREELGNGIVYRNILKYSSSGFINLHVLECELSKDSVDIKVMTAEKGSSYVENTKVMAEKNGAIAGINADFFNLGNKRTNTLGVLYKDGELVSTPSKDRWATFAVNDKFEIIMDYFGFEGKITSPQGYTTELYQINKTASTGGAINMFTPKWGESVFLDENMEALLIKDGIVTEKSNQTGDLYFKDNDAILLTNKTVNGFFDNFSIGDEVIIEYALTDCDDEIIEATGGNTLLVVDGKIAEFTNDVTGYAQRTAAGIDATGKKLIMVVCDGRQADCKGMTQKQLAQTMIDLGCVRAINFDGGGSSVMVTKNKITGELDVKNDVGALRNVSSSIGIFNNSPYIGIPYDGKVILDAETVFLGDYVNVYYEFHDKNSHPCYPENKSDIIITTTDENAKISGSKIEFNTPGKHNIFVSFKGVKKSAEITVISDIQSAYIFPENITLKKGETASVSVTVWDNKGNKAYVHPEKLTWVSEGVSINNGVVGYGTGYVGVKLGNVSAYVSVNGGKTPKSNFNHTEFFGTKSSGKVIRISAGAKQYTSIADMIRVLNYEYTLLGADYLYMTEGPLIKELDFININSFSENIIDDTLIISLDSSSGSINKEKQIDDIINIKNSESKNIIIISKHSPFTFSADEKRLYDDCMKNAVNAGKNIFWAYNGESARTFVENGVHYISFAKIDSDYLNGKDKLKNNMLEFYIDKDKISYSFVR